ncbi:Rad1-domain-containing protein [Pluteus cervinus]|uniref:Rad1-domain-containing protein n=1 Tax=Pluteus cervinus TaxID=181527 RepID=A0ACD3B2E3_9AGAR|nr:Rad1-domain-containing protein [Pluteus cervinus]
MSQEELPPVLKASVHDVRYFVSLLRGVNFVNRATITVTKRGMTITVEESRTLLGTAFIFSEIFDEYIYNPEKPQYHQNLLQREREARANANENTLSTQGSSSAMEVTPDLTQPNEAEDDSDNAAFEVPLNTVIECLNIFGTAGGSGGGGGGSSSGGTANVRRWQRDGDNSGEDNETNAEEGGEEGQRRGGRTRRTGYTGVGGEKRTGMRMTYNGSGYPLTLLLAEDSSGPTTTCEITTFDPEPHLELEFDNDQLILKIILKSSWLRDALSELDPSCEKLTFISNPPPPINPLETGGQRNRHPFREDLQPVFRIQAEGTFGTTEMDYPNDREVLETFECKKSLSYTYRFNHIARTLRALQSSTKTSLRIDDEGLLSLQFLMPVTNKRVGAPGGEAPAAFIEFRCLAVDEEL